MKKITLFFAILATVALSGPRSLASHSKKSPRPATRPSLSAALQGNGTVEFLAIGHPSLLRIHGKGQALTGHFDLVGSRVVGKASFDLNSFDTGIATRDHHMKEKYLETGKYPEATLQIAKIALPAKLPTGDFKMENVAFEGPLTLHGVTKPVSGTVTLARAGGQVIAQAEFGLKISDYGIAIPSFAGITVADEVKVDVHTESPAEVKTTAFNR